MPLATAEEDRSPPRSENRGFRRNYFSFFGNPLTPNSSKFEISPKFCEAFFNPVKFRQIFIKICSKTREIDSKFAKHDEIWWKKCKIKKLHNFSSIFFSFFHQISLFFANFESISSVFEQILMKICRNFTGLKNASQNFGEISNFDELGVRGLPKKLK